MSPPFEHDDEMIAIKDRLFRYLSSTSLNKKAPNQAIVDFLNLLEYEQIIAINDKDNYKVSNIIDMKETIKARIDDVSIGDLKSLYERIYNYLPKTIKYTQDIDKRFRYLETDLASLKTNPEILEKVSKLEKEMEALRKSISSPERIIKEQKDMLKEYKESEKKVFVIMPFAEMFNDVWLGGIERSCRQKEFGYLRVDKIALSSWINEDIKNCIEMANYVIADITGNNPNVMFELGWALALKKTPIVIRQHEDTTNVPFDVKDIRYISYYNTWSGIEKLKEEICKFLQSTTDAEKSTKTSKKAA